MRWVSNAYVVKQHYLTYSLFNAPHVQFSVAQQKAVLEWAEEMGVPYVPSMYLLEKCGEEVKTIDGDSTRMFSTPTGSVYYLNSINAMLQQV